MPLPLQRHRLSVADFHAMVRHGIIEQDARVELIDGEIIEMAPIGKSHMGFVNRLDRMLVRASGDRALASPQHSLTLSDFSAPRPDFVLFKPRADDYLNESPTIADVLLVIEIAHSSLRYERDVKWPLFARHGILVVWLIDVAARTVTCHAEPMDGVYRVEGSPADIGRVPLGLLDDVTVDLSGLFTR